MLNNIAIIGVNGHAGKIRKALENAVNIKHVYHPSKEFNVPGFTQDINDVLGCEGIIIASPNDTHAAYIKQLVASNAYIMCEKPPVTSFDDLAWLREHDLHERLMFNFTYRNSSVVDELLKAISDEKFGELLSISMSMSHGLAYKESYAKSWRSDASRHKLGVIETVGVHFIDIAVLAYDAVGHNIEIVESVNRNIAKNGSAIDTSSIMIKSRTGPSINIFVSYSAPYNFEIHAIGTNGMFHAHNNTMTLRIGRDTFDSNGSFMRPPVAFHDEYIHENEYDVALDKTLAQFVFNVKEQRKFSKKLYDASLKTNEILLSL